MKIGHIATGISDQVRAAASPSHGLQPAGPVGCQESIGLICFFGTFPDLREGFHSGDPAGPTGSSRRGGARVGARPALHLCSGLQLCLEVEDQRWSPGDQMNARAPSCLHRILNQWFLRFHFCKCQDDGISILLPILFTIKIE